MFRITFVAALGLVAFFIAQSLGQGPGGSERGDRQKGREPQTQSLDVISQFDANKNGRLEKEERAKALAKIKTLPRRGRRGRGRSSGGVSKPGRKIKAADVKAYPDKTLYDDSIMRTLFIEFDFDSWEQEMGLLKDYSVDVGAKVTVDNKVYEDVGIRFRGNSSFFTVSDGQKRSLNLSFDWAGKDQTLYGYRTLNLLNSHHDGSFLRSVLYGQIGGQYTAVAKSNYMHVVINGESWGVYINEQQLNTDFTKENFGTRNGARFKAPPGKGTAFTYAGENKSSYANYEIKSKDKDESWTALIKATKALSETPADEVETKVDELISVDRVLWMLAIDNVLIDMDGYHKRGADYSIYYEPKVARMMIMPYDNNETFAAQGGGPGGPPRTGGWFGGGPPRGGPPGGGPPRGGGGPPGGGPGGGGPQSFNTDDPSGPPFALNIFAGIDEPRAPLISKLLKNPTVKARYAAHVRTIYKDWIDWEIVSPKIEDYRELIGKELKRDTRKLTTWDAYEAGIGMGEKQGRNLTPGLKAFFTGRKKYLDSVAELQQPYPEFGSAEFNAESGTIDATLKANTTQPDKVYLYWATNRNAKYKRVEMQKSDSGYSVKLPTQPTGTDLFYYVEGRMDDKYQTTNFYPRFAETKPLKFSPYKKAPPRLDVSAQKALVINEVMASNSKTVTDPQGEYDDWIELANNSNSEIDLTNFYLTDSVRKPKFQFPAGTKIAAGGFLLVWADKDGKKVGGKIPSGHHADFKISKSGETISLVKNEGDSLVLYDSIKTGKLNTDQSIGKTDSKTVIQKKPTPNMPNAE